MAETTCFSLVNFYKFTITKITVSFKREESSHNL